MIVVYGCQSQEGYLEEGAAPSGTVQYPVPQILYGTRVSVLSFCVSMELIDFLGRFFKKFWRPKTLVCTFTKYSYCKCE